MNDETQNNRIHFLYRITNKENNKIYIGQTVEPTKRWYQHRRDAANPTPTMTIGHAIKKYGAENFEYEIIATCKSQDNANELETLLVSQYSSHVSTGKGYNVSLGGWNAPKSDAWVQSIKDWHASLTAEERAKISKKQSQATFKQIAEKGHPAAGRIVTQETRDLMRKIRLENPIEYSEDTRKQMSESHMGKKQPEELIKKRVASIQKTVEKKRQKLIDAGILKCSAPGCEISGKAKYKIINGVRYCNKHGLRMLRYNRLDTLSS
jgi:group I intron endonuclease